MVRKDVYYGILKSVDQSLNMSVSEPSDLVIGDVYSTATYGTEAKEVINFIPTLKCRMCDKCWPSKQRRDLYQHHLLLSHFKHLWATEVPISRKQAGGDYSCNVADCAHQTKNRTSMLIHLARKHKQLEQKLAEEGYPADVMTPIVLTPINKPDMIEKRVESQMTSTTDDSPIQDQDRDGATCALCETSPRAPFFEHVLNEHGLSQSDYLTVKSRLKKEDKKPDLTSLKDATVKVEHTPSPVQVLYLYNIGKWVGRLKIVLSYYYQ